MLLRTEREHRQVREDKGRQMREKEREVIKQRVKEPFVKG